MAVFGEEEYIDNDGNIKTSVKLQEFRSIEAFKEGKIKVPELRKLTDEDWAKWKQAHPAPEPTESRNLEQLNILDDDLPF